MTESSRSSRITHRFLYQSSMSIILRCSSLYFFISATASLASCISFAIPSGSLMTFTRSAHSLSSSSCLLLKFIAFSSIFVPLDLIIPVTVFTVRRERCYFLALVPSVNPVKIIEIVSVKLLFVILLHNKIITCHFVSRHLLVHSILYTIRQPSDTLLVAQDIQDIRYSQYRKEGTGKESLQPRLHHIHDITCTG